MNNEFTKSEKVGRDIFKKQLDNSNKTIEYQFTENQYSPIDVIWYSNNTLNTGEIKYRSGYSSTDKIIQEGGVVLEKTKYDNLKATQNISGATPS